MTTYVVGLAVTVNQEGEFVEPGAALRGPNGQVAIKMGPAVTAGAYFIIDPNHGGHYTNGVREQVDTWQPLVEDPEWEPDADE